MAIEAVFPSGAPAPAAPLSPAVVWGEMVFVSGQVPRDANGTITRADAAAQTRTVIENLRAVLDAAGSSLNDVVKTTVFLTDIADFPAMNEIYREAFSGVLPSRSTVEVSALGKPEFLVEIEAIAVRRTGN